LALPIPEQSVVLRTGLWDRCYDFKNSFDKIIDEKIGVLTKNKAKPRQICIRTVFEKNANFFTEVSKIAENYDHNIDPRKEGSTHISVDRRRHLSDGRRLAVDHLVQVRHQVEVQPGRGLHFCPKS
jgi:hypothetical protein